MATPLLPESLAAFYDSHSVPSSAVEKYLKNEHPSHSSRFVRLNPRFCLTETLSLLSSELSSLSPPYPPSSLTPVTWLPSSANFYAMPSSVPLSTLPSYKSGRVYGMDTSSGAAVSALVPLPPSPLLGHGVSVLDLCCSPGQKLCMLADAFLPALLSSSISGSSLTVVGVDISSPRLSVSRRLVSKYLSARNPLVVVGSSSVVRPVVRLYHCDGTSFLPSPSSSGELFYDSRAADQEEPTREPRQEGTDGKPPPPPRKRMNKSARARDAKRLKDLAAADAAPQPSSGADEGGLESEAAAAPAAEPRGGESKSSASASASVPVASSAARQFDYVLVDAECSTDGALRHLQHRLKSDPLAAACINVTSLDSLTALQVGLLSNGFKNLKVGGSLVYSTCSLSRAQNEGVVERFFAQFVSDGEASVVPVDLGGDTAAPTTSGGIEHTLRFTPRFEETESGDMNSENADEAVPMSTGGGFFICKIKRNF